MPWVRGDDGGPFFPLGPGERLAPLFPYRRAFTLSGLSLVVALYEIRPEREVLDFIRLRAMAPFSELSLEIVD